MAVYMSNDARQLVRVEFESSGAASLFLEKSPNECCSFDSLFKLPCVIQVKSNPIMSSSGSSSNPFAMMESVALNESRVIVEDIDYVLVDAAEPKNTNAMELDDDSYDYCEDVESILSVERPPSSLSVCSDLPSIDPTSFGIETMTTTKEEPKPVRRPRVISFGNDEDELKTRTGKFESNIEPLDEQMVEADSGVGVEDDPSGDGDDRKIPAVEFETSGEPLDEQMNEAEQNLEPPVVTLVTAEPEPMMEEEQEEKMFSESEERIESIAEKALEDMKPTTSRLSNKKRRKKMKLMKRAAAAAAAAAALSEMTAYVPTAPTLPSSPSRKTKKPKSSKTRKAHNSVAVACATETMESYRQELANTKKKGSSKFVSPL